MSVKSHRKSALKKMKIGVITVSTTRTPDTDESGTWILRRIKKEGHQGVFYQVVPDQEEPIVRAVEQAIAQQAPHALFITGGTGLSPADVTIEAVKPLFQKEITAFQTLFTLLSFDQIDSAALLSRACAGVKDHCLVFCMPGSLKACKLALTELIFPELGHMAHHAQRPPAVSSPDEMETDSEAPRETDDGQSPEPFSEEPHP